MYEGTVKFFNESKGYGFIVEEGTDKEIFVHISGLTEPVMKDDRVSYEVREGRQGMNAVNVKRL